MQNPRATHLVVIGIEPIQGQGLAVHLAPDPAHHGPQPQEATITVAIGPERLRQIRDAVKGLPADG